MTRVCILLSSLAVIVRTRVPVLPGWVVPVPAVFLAVALALVGGATTLLALRMRSERLIPVTGGAITVKSIAAGRWYCAYCSNTGTASARWCPVCRPNGGGAK